jgi:trimethylamine--corrinoid protein Co-methyltransferase
MKSGEITVGNSQYTKIIAAVAEIADYYNMPSLVAGGITDSEKTDNQAGYETMLNMHTAVGSGVDIIIYAAGSIADYMGVSYEKVIQDTNILKNIENYQNGVDVNEDSIAQDVVKEVGGGGNFMTHPHTMESLEKRLGKKISTENNVLSNYQQPNLDNNLDKKLKKMSDK